MNWYPLRVISGKESKVKDNLLFELDYQNLIEEVTDILIPSENIVEMKDGKKKIKNKRNSHKIYDYYLLGNLNDEFHFQTNDILKRSLITKATKIEGLKAE